MLLREVFVTPRLGLTWCALIPTSALLISLCSYLDLLKVCLSCKIAGSLSPAKLSVLCISISPKPGAWHTAGLQSCTVAGCVEVYPAPTPGLLIHKSKTHCLPSRSCWYVEEKEEHGDNETMWKMQSTLGEGLGLGLEAVH